MRIVHVYHYYQPGLSYEENRLPAAQAQLGADVTIVTSTVRPGDWSSLDAEESPDNFARGDSSDNGVRLLRLRPRFGLKVPAAFALHGLTAALEGAKPDIVHLHSATGALAMQSMRATNRLSVPLVVDSHQSMFPSSALRRIYYGVFRYLIHPLLARKVRAWMVISPDAENLLVERLGRSRSSITQMLLGAPLRKPVSPTDRVALRADYGIGSGDLIATFAGRITPNKRIELLLAALGEVGDRWWVALVGPVAADYRRQLMDSLTPRTARRVLFLGEVDQTRLDLWLGASDVGVWPGEPGVTILQGMAAGLPLILAEHPATTPYLAGNGVTFRDHAQLVYVLMDLQQDESSRLAMSRASADRARMVFSWRSLAERSLRIYERALGEGDPTIPPLWS